MTSPIQQTIPPSLEVENLTLFIDELRREGYKIGAQQFIAAQDLVVALAAKNVSLHAVEQVASFLGPVLTSRAKEQKEFPALFAEFTARYTKAPEDSQQTQADKDDEKDFEKDFFKYEKWYQLLRRIAQIMIIIFFIGSISFLLHLSGIILTVQEKVEETEPGKRISTKIQQSTQNEGKTKSKPSDPTPKEDKIRITNIKLYLPIAIIIFLWIVWKVWKFWVGDRFLRRRRSKEEPDIINITVTRSNAEIIGERNFKECAGKLRRHDKQTSTRLDVDATIEATVKAGGWLQTCHGIDRITPEYLVLIERDNEKDIQARYVDEVFDILEKEDIFAVRYYYRDDLRVCTSRDPKEGTVTLTQLMGRYPKFRLLIVSDGSDLFDRFSGKLANWVQSLTTWQYRAILSPVPVDAWGQREHMLAGAFNLVPFSAEGLKTLIQRFRSTSQTIFQQGKRAALCPGFLQKDPERWLQRDPPPQQRVGLALKALQIWLGYETYYWFCTCAIYPGISWNLMLYLGENLKSKSNKSLLSGESLLEMARLPWFRRAYMPDWLRERLLQELPSDKEMLARKTVDKLFVTALHGLKSGETIELAWQKKGFMRLLVSSAFRRLHRAADRRSKYKDYVFIDFMKGPSIAVRLSRVIMDWIGFQREPIISDERKRTKQVLGLGVAAYTGFSAGSFISTLMGWDILPPVLIAITVLLSISLGTYASGIARVKFVGEMGQFYIIEILAGSTALVALSAVMEINAVITAVIIFLIPVVFIIIATTGLDKFTDQEIRDRSESLGIKWSRMRIVAGIPIAMFIGGIFLAVMMVSGGGGGEVAAIPFALIAAVSPLYTLSSPIITILCGMQIRSYSITKVGILHIVPHFLTGIIILLSILSDSPDLLLTILLIYGVYLLLGWKIRRVILDQT